MTSQEAYKPAIWRLRQATPGEGNVWLTLQHPTSLELMREPLSGVRPPSDKGTILTFVHLLPGIETPFDVQKEFETWVLQDDTTAPYLEVSGRNIRLVWRGRRGLAFAPIQAAEDCLAAAAVFSHVYGALSVEESRLETTWQSMTNDVALTHDVRRIALREQRRVNQMTRQFQTARIFVARMDIALQRPESKLSAATRRLFGELALQADLISRVRVLDDAIEVGEDLYELANDRLIEHRNYLVEVWIETAILFAILAELAVLLVDFFSR
ncbi:hypothetical protein C1D09_030105 [Mesorhizobium intechi]|uniref:hypothetical protein n=1 Tax=Mesorhizobium intechi TaxID=537601 RepID=UPI000CB8F3AD|nr:hypothetical protein [Mesorhizobium intechi]TSE02397.1 hypothetical protein C1D09_030105 [Mesorhizobium intechi]